MVDLKVLTIILNCEVSDIVTFGVMTKLPKSINIFSENLVSACFQLISLSFPAHFLTLETIIENKEKTPFEKTFLINSAWLNVTFGPL